MSKFTSKKALTVPSRQGGDLVLAGYIGDTPPDEVILAISAYLVTGTLKGVQERTGVAHDVFSGWKREAWYPEIVDMLRSEQQAVLDAKLSRVIDRSIEALEDRLAEGDYQFSKEGELRRLPVSASVATKLFGTVYEKRQIVRGEATSIVKSDKSGIHALGELLDKIAKAKRPEKEIPGESVRIKC